VLGRFEAEVAPAIPTLRHAIIHGDANDHNVLVAQDGASIAGLIDFGDSLYTAAIYDLGITVAYGASLFLAILLSPFMYLLYKPAAIILIF
jgi:Ser/Thr protein kinase RdoA (MazF antagonist)